MTERREFLGLVAAYAVMASASRFARAHPAAKTPRVAFVHPSVQLAEMVGTDPVDSNLGAFVHRLHELGYVEGRNVSIERRSAEGQLERLPVLMKELVELRVDVIVAVGNAVNEAQLATSAIPIVAWIDDPVAAGLTSSLSRPTRNVTGVSGTVSPAIYGKRLQLLKEAAPRRRIIDFAAQRRLPAIYARREFPEAGGLMSYAPRDLPGGRMAVYVDRILKGAKPSDLPFEQPTNLHW